MGAGVAGLACAVELGRRRHAVTLFDKGRVPGGRLSTRTLATPLGPVGFDHGVRFFTALDAAFRAEVSRWQQDGPVSLWSAAGVNAWVGVPGMNAPALAMAERCDVRASTRVEAIWREGMDWRLGLASGDVGPFDNVVVAVPAEQAADLLAPVDAGLAARAAQTLSLPCWTVMAAFSARLPITADVLAKSGVLAWAGRDSSKPDRGTVEAWVLQATPDWTRQHLEDAPESVERHLLAALRASAQEALPDPVAATAHRWRFAHAGRLGRAFVWRPDLRLGLCGDWLLGPEVESAWLSGYRLAGAIGAFA